MLYVIIWTQNGKTHEERGSYATVKFLESYLAKTFPTVAGSIEIVRVVTV